MDRLLGRKPVKTIVYSAAGGNITTGAWKEILASLGVPCTSLEIYNSTGQPLKLATGGAGSEVTTYTVVPNGTTEVLGIGFASGTRLSAKAIGSNATTGYLILNLFA